MAFITNKEEADKKLSLKLYKEGLITTFNILFKASQKQKIDGLISRGVFKFKLYNPVKYRNQHIFNLRIINKVKDKTTNALYKKFRLVI
jgi:hypothetical protein